MGDRIGVKVVVSQGALNHFKDKIMPYAEAKVMAAHFDDMESQKKVRGFGKVKLEVREFVLTSFHVSSSSIELVSPNSLVVSFSGVDIRVEMRWRYHLRRFHTSDSGRGEAKTEGSNVGIVFVLGTDAQGRPTATISDCWVGISHFHMRLHNHLTWLYDALIDLFRGQIVRSIERAVRHAITSDLQNAINRMLSRIPIQEHVGKDCVIDYRLTSPGGIFITPERQLITQSPGEFYWEHENPGHSPGMAVLMPNDENGSMFQIFISAFSIRSFCHASMRSGKLNRDFFSDSSIVPMPFFTTGFYLKHVPGLVSKYGTDKSVSFRFELHETPTVAISQEKKVTAAANIEMALRVHTSAESFENALSFVLRTTCTGTAKVNDNLITGEIIDVHSKADLLRSSVGDVDTDIVTEITMNFLNMLKPEFNKKLARGAPLPWMKGIQYVNPQVHYHDGFIVVTTDVIFTPDF